MPRSKINLEKLRTALLTTCPHCKQQLQPAEWMRVDGERIQCLKCQGMFIEERSKNRMT